MRRLHRHVVADGDVVHVGVTDRTDGDLAIGAPDVERRRRALVDRPWRWLRQVHGADVLDADDPQLVQGAEGDALVSGRADVALAVQTADCVPVALLADDGPFAVVHAGWRGLVAGVVERATAELRTRTATPICAVVGPFIRADCYEFGTEIEVLVDRYGPTVGGVTGTGAPALDLDAALRAALGAVDVEVVVVDGRCTCDPDLFSHRLRADTGRQALVAWRER